MLFIINDTIEVTLVEGIDANDYPDMVDAFVSEAYWIGLGKRLTDSELENINKNYSEKIQAFARDHVII